jgi:hypothetical protein
MQEAIVNIGKRIDETERRIETVKEYVRKNTEIWLSNDITRDEIESLIITLNNQKERLILLEKEREVLHGIYMYLSLNSEN